MNDTDEDATILEEYSPPALALCQCGHSIFCHELFCADDMEPPGIDVRGGCDRHGCKCKQWRPT